MDEWINTFCICLFFDIYLLRFYTSSYLLCFYIFLAIVIFVILFQCIVGP